MTHSEDREQQAAVSRLLLYHLNRPLSEGCRLLGVLPAPRAVRIAVHAGDHEEGITFLYEIPHDVVAPASIPGILRTTLAGTQLYSSSDIGEVMGMTLIRLHPERITPAPESEEERTLGVLRALSDPGDDEDPFLIGFLMRGEGLLRLYVRHPDGTRVIGADIRPADTLTVLISALPSLVEEDERHRPSPDDPHCDLLVDLTDW
ncbi:hypothetical protein [Streptomyces caniscabiei]|uniref:Uncharacterized protein n=1 Tax=Streptomyces caniscabiei TaxID=2746961 RepID=A0A927L9P4_9ACTN|nr:hypothetical protein [Streptomyces caniscabiei]MBD9728020.1 hypothetical protein [Streptomyces caniscabiei]MDX3513966.1 hypothetical protein [Streptomyces caniscabiei]MDX3722968.1 hypothetical protein [Streptomyces caniscabiei]MDX3732457.1 hypothetical protein [Streptomyces caniscabiei]WEO23506.1 hypothetical protein IHE65_10210 [Streptomyces caniscabiei]